MAQIAIEMTSEEARLWQGFQRIIRQQQKLEGGLGRTSRKTEQSAKKATLAEQAYDKAFGRAAISSLSSFASGVVGIGAAVTTVISLFQEMHAEAQRVAEAYKESVVGVGSLAQLAETPQEMKRLVAAANKTFAEGGGNTLDDAAKLVFALESAGALDERELFSQLKAKNLVEEPDVLARAAATLNTSIGEEETGGFRPLVSKAFGASKFAPATAEALLEAAARSGGSAKALGISDEELLAATAVESKATGSAEIGGTAVASLLRSLDKKGTFVGKGLMESLEEIEGMNLQGEELQKYFGRQEAVRAYRDLLANKDLVAEAMSEVQTAEAQDRVSQKLALSEGVPSLDAAQEAKKAEARRTVASEEIGTFHNLADALVDQRAAETLQDGSYFPRTENAYHALKAKVDRFALGDENFLRFQQNEITDEVLKAKIKKALSEAEPPKETPGIESVNIDPGTQKASILSDAIHSKSRGLVDSFDADLSRDAFAIPEGDIGVGRPNNRDLISTQSPFNPRNQGKSQEGDQLKDAMGDGGPFSKFAQQLDRLNNNIEVANAKNAIAGPPTLSPPNRDR